MSLRTDSQARRAALKQLLVSGAASTQDELREQLEKRKFEVNQSTISRDLRRLGAVKSIDSNGEVVYRLSDTAFGTLAQLNQVAQNQIGTLVTDLHHNGQLIVVHTSPGSASLVARVIDQRRHELGVLGTIAGDDTVFIAPQSTSEILKTVRSVKTQLEQV